MCGITGFCGAGSGNDLRAMTNALWHRGPDDGGLYQDGKISLGHRRLSVLDLAHGKQPMRDSETGAVIVYNGEIYNHSEIRAELKKLGQRFQTAHSDTETVLYSFLHWREKCLLRFNGMFAFAIYLPQAGQLWLARDRFGEKPLFYTQNQQGFAFASEIAALRLWPGFCHDPDCANIQRFFAWNYLPGNRCATAGCHSLGPGSWLCLQLENQTITTGKYWQFELNPDAGWNDEQELCEELRRLLVQAVKRRLLADVPLGIFLSGGLDSSAILAAACKCAEPDSLETFTIGFREKSFDESQKAASVAKHLAVKNSLRYLTEAEMQGAISAVLGQMSEPFGDASLIPTWQLCAFAREKVTVALSGDGGDELFGGYDPLAAIRPAAFYRKLVPQWLHIVLRRLAQFLRNSDRNMSLDFKIRRFLRGLSQPEDLQLPVWMSGLEPAEIRDFFRQPLAADELYKDVLRLFARHPDYDGLAKALMFFTCLYLPDDILVKSDRASMMNSLETRAVFLDNDIVEFCRKLPMRFKYRRGQRKYLLKKALAAWLPENILRQRKKGFGIPLNRWLRSLKPVQAQIPGLRKDVLAACESAHQQRRGDFRFFLWDAQAYVCQAE